MPNDGESRKLRLEDIPQRLNYPVSEAAVLLGLSDTTTWRRVDEGLLETVYDGGRRLVPRQALLDYAASREPATGRTRRRKPSTAAA